MQFIPLSRGLWATVDDEDWERLSTYKWCALKAKQRFYAIRNSQGSPNRLIYMHHEVMGGKPPSGYETDHIDGDGLNNQKRNLRWATHSQNHMNLHHTWGKSRFKGINWETRRNKWVARICVDGKITWLGRFDSEEDAARAYDAAALEQFGEFARLNFSEEPVMIQNE